MLIVEAKNIFGLRSVFIGDIDVHKSTKYEVCTYEYVLGAYVS